MSGLRSSKSLFRSPWLVALAVIVCVLALVIAVGLAGTRWYLRRHLDPVALAYLHRMQTERLTLPVRWKTEDAKKMAKVAQVNADAEIVLERFFNKWNVDNDAKDWESH